MRAVLQTAAANPKNQDRGAVIDSSPGLVLVVADGAGGLSGGAEAAAMAVEFVRQNAWSLRDADPCVHLLERMDRAIAQDSVAGETTCALAVVAGNRAYGASVGDSGVWVIRESGFTDLTKWQSRKPFIGTGFARPMSFVGEVTGTERLLVATDGLLKYTSADRIAETCRPQDIEAAARQLILLVRYPSGALPDDVTVILAQGT